MEDEIIILTDESGNEYQMDLIERFDHDGGVYVVMTEAHSCGDDGCSSCDGCGETAVYVMKEENLDGQMHYSQVEDDKLEDLIAVVQELLGVEEHDEDCCCDHH